MVPTPSFTSEAFAQAPQAGIDFVTALMAPEPDARASATQARAGGGRSGAARLPVRRHPPHPLSPPPPPPQALQLPWLTASQSAKRTLSDTPTRLRELVASGQWGEQWDVAQRVSASVLVAPPGRDAPPLPRSASDGASASSAAYGKRLHSGEEVKTAAAAAPGPACSDRSGSSSSESAAAASVGFRRRRLNSSSSILPSPVVRSSSSSSRSKE